MRKHLHAYSLIECLLVLALLLSGVIVAVPFYADFINKQRAATHINQLASAIHYARSEAIKRGEVITLCKSHDGQTCTGDWQDGYIVFVDYKANGRFDEGDELLRQFDTINNKDSLTFRGFPSSNYLRMAPSGFTYEQNGTFYYCPSNQDVRYARALIIDKAGRVRLSRDENKAGVHQDAQGKTLTCQ